MPSWKFSDEYGSQYPALKSSILNLLVFSEHSLEGTKFTGTIDLAASGMALQALSSLTNLTSVAVSGEVADADKELTVKLQSTGNEGLVEGLAKNLPVIGSKLSAASLELETIATTSETEDEGPETDQLTMSVTIAVGSASVTLTALVPMAGGIFTIEGSFDGVKVTLEDVSFLAGKLSGNTDWFPSTELGPYFKEAGLALLGLELTLFLKPKPFSIRVTSISLGIGMVGLAVLDQKLYLNPLGVWTVVTDPLGSPQAVWSVVGGLALCNFDRPGDYQNPDLLLDLSMDLTNFLFSARLENPSDVSINQALKDLLGKDTSIGLPTALTLKEFDLEIGADKKSGSLDSFSADLMLSGGFGIFETVDVEELSLSVEYSA